MKFTRRQFLGLASAFGLASCAKVKNAVPDLNLARFTPSFGGDEFTFATINDLHVLDTKSAGIVNQAVRSIVPTTGFSSRSSWAISPPTAATRSSNSPKWRSTASKSPVSRSRETTTSI